MNVKFASVAKKTAVGIAALLIVAVLFFVFKAPPRYFYSYDKERLLDNEAEYTEIAKVCLEHRAEHGKDINGAIPKAGQVHEFTIYCDECDAPLNKNVTDAAKAVKQSFYLAKHGLDGIRVYENFVSFGIVTGSASLIYSESGEKPTFVNSPDGKHEPKKPYVEKITEHWYYAC